MKNPTVELIEHLYVLDGMLTTKARILESAERTAALANLIDIYIEKVQLLLHAANFAPGIDLFNDLAKVWASAKPMPPAQRSEGLALIREGLLALVKVSRQEIAADALSGPDASLKHWDRTHLPGESQGERPYPKLQEPVGSRILIVEDDAINRRILEKMLAPYGECDFAIDGREGLIAFLTALEKREPYRLACLDIMMPFLDGLALLKHIRFVEAEMKRFREKAAKIIMTTALDDADHVIGSFRQGCEDYLVKPIDQAKLREILERMEIRPAA